jgi:UDP-N-acetylmuramate dehydrogenase
MQVLQNHSLLPYNTFGIEASSKLFVNISSLTQLQEVLADTQLKAEQKLILGGGSNLLFTNNFNGLTLKNSLKGIEVVKETPEHYYIKAQAGENWHAFVLHCIAHNYSGVENMSLIPGNVGASPMQNIGAYGVEIKDVFESLDAIEIATGAIRTFTHSECNFGYRDSVFKNIEKDKYIITSVTYRLNKQPNLNTSYGAIEQELERMQVTEPTIKDVSNAVIAIRQSKLPDPAKIGNAGSFFKNPVIPVAQFLQVQANFPEVASYKISDTHYKLAAGWLIEQAGWKGKTFNNTFGVHKNQALVLVNYGGCSGSDIFDLSQQIIGSVFQKFGVQLEREVNLI